MQGISLKYSKEGLAEFDFSTRRDTRGALLDRALINVGTEQGSCPIYDDRGVVLLRRALAGLVYDARSAQHQCNFASHSTLFFLRKVDTAGQDLRVTDVKLFPETLSRTYLGLQMQLSLSDGTVAGIQVALS